jgi:hypothetical protein
MIAYLGTAIVYKNSSNGLHGCPGQSDAAINDLFLILFDSFGSDRTTAILHRIVNEILHFQAVYDSY